MNLFGIPLFLSFSYFKAFLIENLPILTNLSDDGILISYLIANFMYIFFIIICLVFVCKILIYIKNHYC